MEKPKSLKKNFIYNLTLNLLNILFPLITSPYVSRILGATSLGKVNFATSVAAWFMTIASFGIPIYGIREISKVRDDKDKLSSTFTELLIIQCFFTIIVVLIYSMVAFLVPIFKNEIILFGIYGLYLLLNIFSLDWFYQGIEQYGYITARSTFVKLLSLILIFVTIHTKSDYLIYGLLSVFALSFNNVLNFIHSRKYVRINFAHIVIRRHFHSLGIFFISSVIVSLYSQLDQVFVGFFSSMKSVAFYSRGRQIISMVLTVTSSISTILIPRTSYLFNNNVEEYKRTLKSSLNYIYILAIPMTIGVTCLAKEIMYFFGGKEYEQGYEVLIILPVLIIIVALGTWGFNQVLIPSGNEKYGVISQAIMAVADIGLNIMLIPRYGYVGACMAIVISEFIGTIIGVIISIKLYRIQYITKSFFQYIFASIVMAVLLYIERLVIHTNLFYLLVAVMSGAMIYCLTLALLKEQTFLGILRNLSENVRTGKGHNM